MPSDYDWKVVTLIQRASKQLVDDLEKLMAAKCAPWYQKTFGEAYRLLDTRLHLAT